MTSTVLKPEAFEAIQPLEYQARFFDKGIRSDGRGFHETRPISIVPSPINTASGSALIRLGETVIIAGVKAEVAVPTLAEPDSGYLVINVELPPFLDANVGMLSAGPSVEARELTQALHQLYRTCSFLAPRSLCIASGQAVWTLYVDLVCLNNDGNLFDAAVLACSAALRDVRLPKVAFDDNKACVTALSLPQLPLSLAASEEPFPFSLLLLDSKRNGSVTELADPLKKEHSFDGSLVHVVLSSACPERILYLSKAQGSAISHERLLKCIELAQQQLSISARLLSCSE